jgi:hypothetical protein
MNYLKIALIILLLSFSGGSFAQNTISVETITDQQHPRILLLKGEESQIRKSVAGSPYWKNMHEAILTECNNILNLPPVERIQIGRRLLDKSREALRRIFHLSYAWRMTGVQKYFDRCEKEMLAISKFNDWNPSHFLDVGEMTMAMAIGYDWLFPNLSAESKKIIRDAIVYKGIYPSLDPKYNSWLRVSNNWNQVCNAGMTFGALAVAEDHPGLSKNIIERAIASIPLAMDEYKPDGAYPEGYGYWGYGTSFNVMFLSAIETVFKSDFELNSAPGFLQTAGFLQNMTGATGPCFNWGDCGLGGSLNPAMFWLAQKNNDPSLLWVEKGYLQHDDYSGFTRDRLLPSIMIWGKDLPLEKVTEPMAKVWKGQGANPLAMMRTSWTSPEAVYLGFKAGSPSVNHGHMDVGSFVMEADGERWASDPGMQSYESLESKGMSIFGKTQDAQRWTIFRLNNHAHNVLTFDGQLQQVSGYAKIDKTSGKEGFKFAISDISTVYNNQVKKAVRGVAIQDEKYVVVRDEIETTGKTTKVKWAMFTFATAELGENSATLTIGSKKLYLKVNAPAGITMKTWSTAPTNDYDATNPGTIMVGFECEIPANTKAVFEVLLVPEKAKEMAQFLNKKLDDWN